jgi:glycosyltransferase involved in cell wall biosynthesis
MKISVVVLAKNEAHQIRRCFDSLAALEPEFIVVDDESTDDTVKIAQEEYGAKIIHSKSEGNFDRQRNKGIEAATGKWVIQTAPDEVWVPQTIQKMKELFLWGLPLEDAYMIERCECVFERPISHLKPRHEIRVLRKGKCRYTGSKIHETLEVDGSRS